MEGERTMMLMMMSSSSSPPIDNPRSCSRNESAFCIPEASSKITTSACPSWKLYENPFYNYQQQSHCRHVQQYHHQRWHSSTKPLHLLHLPLSARKVATSFSDLPFLKPRMGSDQLQVALAQIVELKAAIDYERRVRKKTESINRKLARELSEERKGREAVEKVCEELARELSCKNEEMYTMRNEIEEERKMIKMSQVLREERVRMKLADAKAFFEEKLLELEAFKRIQNEESTSKLEQKNRIDNIRGIGNFSVSRFPRGSTRSAFLMERPDIVNSLSALQRKASTEAENPHIKRGIKGFVEFPKVVRAIGSKSRHWGTKLECQKAQLRVMLNQRTPVRSNHLIRS